MSKNNGATLQLVEAKLVEANPFQQRSTSPVADDMEFLESVRAHGLIQPPIARAHPTKAGRFQLAVGHRRKEAWVLTHEGEPMPLFVRELSDGDLWSFCFDENYERADVNVIDRARLIGAYIERMKCTQADAAKFFGLKNPASVANLLRLLKLPEAVQALVSADSVPQRIARALVPIAMNPKLCTQIAQAVAKAEPDEREEVFADESRRFFIDEKNARELELWNEDWVAPFNVNQVQASCAGCPHACEWNGARWCTQSKNMTGELFLCYEAKRGAWQAAEVQRVSEEKKIKILADGEVVRGVILDGKAGQYAMEATAAVLVKAKRPELRVRAGSTHAQYGPVVNVLGSGYVELVTVDKAATDAWLKEKNEKTRAKAEPPADDETEAQRKKRIEAEEEERAERRAERAALLKCRYDTDWLIETAMVALAAQLKIEGGILPIVVDNLSGYDYNKGEFQSFDVIVDRRNEAIHAAEKAKNKQAAVTAMREHIVAEMLCSAVAGSWDKSKRVYNDWTNILDDVRRVADELELRLPPKWDRPPIHRTAFNCWQCGVFASNEKLTKRDVDEDGWIDAGEDGVFCNAEHQAAFARSQSVKAGAKKSKYRKK